ncbi:hypothetical protein D3C84_1182490 [compost metagenome]
MASILRASIRLSYSRDTASSNQRLSIRRPVSRMISKPPTASQCTVTDGTITQCSSNSRKIRGGALRL